MAKNEQTMTVIFDHRKFNEAIEGVLRRFVSALEKQAGIAVTPRVSTMTPIDISIKPLPRRLFPNEIAQELIAVLPQHQGSLALIHNEHKDTYTPVAKWCADNTGWMTWENDEARSRAIKMDSVWQLVWYPDTPVGHCCLCAPTLSELLEMAKKERR